MRKLFLCYLLLILSIGLASAVTLDSGTVINTTGSNSSMTFNEITIIADLIQVEPTYVLIHNASWKNGELTVNVTGIMNWSDVNSNIDSIAYGKITSSTNTIKKFSWGINQTLNGTLAFTTQTPQNLIKVVYTSDTETFSQTFKDPDLIITGQDVTIIDVVGLQPSIGQNLLVLGYGCGDISRGTLNLIRAVMALAVVFGILGLFVWKGNMLQNPTPGMMLFFFVIATFGVMAVVVVSNSIFTICPP